MKQRHSEEHKAKIAASVRRHYEKPENREANRQRIKAYNAKVKAALAAYEVERQSGGGSDA